MTLISHNSYDTVPYLNRAHSRTHPDRAAALAILLGLEPPPVARCRVLELGCANGRNLLPMPRCCPKASSSAWISRPVRSPTARRPSLSLA